MIKLEKALKGAREKKGERYRVSHTLSYTDSASFQKGPWCMWPTVLRRRQCWNKQVHGGVWNAGQKSLTIAEICGYFIGNSFIVLRVVGHLILEFKVKIYCLWIFHQFLSSEIFSFYFKPENGIIFHKQTYIHKYVLFILSLIFKGIEALWVLTGIQKNTWSLILPSVTEETIHPRTKQ